MKIESILVFLLMLAVNSLYAQSMTSIYADTIGSPEIAHTMDKDYKTANEIFLKKKDAIKTPSGFYIVNYKKAYELYKKSATQNDNPISAYAALYIMEQHYPRPANEKNKLVKILYEHNKNSCTANLWYGDLFLRGTAEKKNPSKALSVYKSVNLDKCSDWQKSVIRSRIATIEMGFDK